MRKSFFIYILFLSVIFLLVSRSWVHSATPIPEKQVEKLLSAIQKKDFKSIFNMCYYYQMELSQIKRNNPKALWEKLTTEYYESKKIALFEEKEESLTDAVVRFGGQMFGSPTDPVESIKVLINLLPLSCKWKIIETKKEKHLDHWSDRQYDVFVVYVSLNYKSVEESPLIESQFIKETILGFLIDAKTGLYIRSGRIGKSDVYWGGDPSTDFAIARNLFNYGLTEKSINILENLEKKGMLNDAGKKLLAAVYSAEVHRKGFVNYSGGYTGFNTYYDWRSKIEKAIAFEPNIREAWIHTLVGIISLNSMSRFGQYSGGDETVNLVARVADEFSQGYPELEKLIYKPKLELANIYINWAKRSNNLHFISKYLGYAKELCPEDFNITRSSKEILKAIIDNEVKKALRQQSFVFMELHHMMAALEVFDSFKLSLEPHDTPLFAKAAELASKKYRTMINKKERAIYWEDKAKEWSIGLHKPSAEKIEQAPQMHKTIYGSLMAKREWDKLAKIARENIEELITLLKDKDAQVRREAAGGLGFCGDKRAVDPLIEALKDENARVRSFSAISLGKIGDKRAIDPLIAALKDEDVGVRGGAAITLGRIGDKRAIDQLIVALKDNDAIVRNNAAISLGEIGDQRAADPLIAALKDEDSRVRARAEEALRKIGWSPVPSASSTPSQPLTKTGQLIQESKTPSAPAPQIYEAEQAILAGSAKVNNEHSGYSGSGYVDGYGYRGLGSTTTFTVKVPSAGDYKVTLRYANAIGTVMTVSIYVNGIKIKQTALLNLRSWDTWADKVEILRLNAGENIIAYRYDPGDTGNINIDFISISQ